MVTADDFEALGKESFDNKTAVVVLQSGCSEHFLKPNILRCCQLEIVTMDSGSGSRWPTGWLLSFHHIIQHIHVARLGSVPPRRASYFCRTNRRLSDKNTARSRQATGTVPASKKSVSALERASSKLKISGGFSAAILRGSSGIKKCGCRPCEASEGHRESTPENCITLRANVQQSIHETAIVFVH